MRKEIKLNKMKGKRSTITTAAETVLIFMCIVYLEKPTALKHTVTKSNYISHRRKHEKFLLCKTIR